MLEYDRIDISEEIDINRANGSKEGDIFQRLWTIINFFHYI